jgi:hypothetical protein
MVCEEGAAEEERRMKRRRRVVQNQKQEPHTKMWGILIEWWISTSYNKFWCNYSGGYPQMQNLDWPMYVLMMCIYVNLRSKNTYKLGLVYVMMMTIYYLDWFMF